MLKFCLWGLRHPKLVKLLWKLRVIKFGQFRTPSGEPYVGFKVTIGGANRAVRNLAVSDDEMLNYVIERWRKEYERETGKQLG